MAYAVNHRGLVSLFSGCGGLDLGLHKAGFTPLVCIESAHDACDSLRLNRVAPDVIERKIQDVPSEEILALTGFARGQLPLLAGGPPCPPYSKSRFYRKEKPRALDDPTADTLREYLRVLRDLLPKTFLLENVPGLAYKVHAGALQLIRDTAAALGYTIRYQVINAADYGVPQIRERLFIVGSRLGRPFDFPNPTHSIDGDHGALVPPFPWVGAGDVLRDLDTDEAANDIGHRAGGRHQDLLAQVPPGDNYLFFTKERGHPTPLFTWRSRYWSFLLKLSPDRPSWTIQARRSNNMGPFHWRNRILRLEEIKRLQTFPDTWQICGKVDSAWRQIGNAVPPKLAEVLGRQLLDLLADDGVPRDSLELSYAGT